MPTSEEFILSHSAEFLEGFAKAAKEAAEDMRKLAGEWDGLRVSLMHFIEMKKAGK